jgi:Raf kinase inhibitor-like YbhB/YbcL family protein
MTIRIASTAFEPHRPIPKTYTGEGPDISPPLAWSGVPEPTKELALICDDPDAPTPEPWVHWILYKLSPTRTGLRESDNGGGVEGKNSFEKIGYGGPLPPRGDGMHHYHFKLYALDQPLTVGAGLSKDQLLAAMKGHVLAQGELIGTYERK